MPMEYMTKLTCDKCKRQVILEHEEATKSGWYNFRLQKVNSPNMHKMGVLCPDCCAVSFG